jgi:hypothetical protein
MVGRMKNKLLIGILLSTTTCSLMAFKMIGHQNAVNEDMVDLSPGKTFPNENKLPRSGDGVKIIPLGDMYPIGNSKKLLEDFKTQKEKGFVNEKSEPAKKLLGLQRNKFINGNEKTYLSNDPHDTHLKKSFEQIKLAFDHHPISFIKEKDIIGFAAAGTYQSGWTGITETFNYKDFGVCDYILHNFQITGGAALLSEEFVTYDINKKSTVITITGNKETGFMTQIEWYDDIFYHTLECASKEFKKENTETFITLAKDIDND